MVAAAAGQRGDAVAAALAAALRPPIKLLEGGGLGQNDAFSLFGLGFTSYLLHTLAL